MAALASLFGTQWAAGHDFWVEPDRFHARVGDTVEIRLYQGQRLKGETLPYIPDWFTRFEHITASGRYPIRSNMGDDPAASLQLAAPGVNWVLYRSTRDFVKLDAVIFNRYLREEGLEHIAEYRETRGQSDTPAREYFSRCAKSLISVDGASPAYDADFGMTLELIPLADPSGPETRESLPLRVRFLTDPLEGALVVAFRRSDPKRVVSARTDSDGMVSLRLQGEGVWLVKVVHMIRLEDDGRAEWESFWASLMFERNYGRVD